jgi:hypothetical protein
MGGKCFKEVKTIKSIQVAKKQNHEQLPEIEQIHINSKHESPKKLNKSLENSSDKIANTAIAENRNHKSLAGPTKFDTDLIEVAEGINFTILQSNNQDLDDFELINKCLSKHFFMQSLEKSSWYNIIKEMSLVSLSEGSLIFKQGEIGIYFYIIKSGEVSLRSNGNNIKVIHAGESFGELALLHQATRSGTCVANKESTFWVLERRLFRRTIEHINSVNFEENKSFIQSIPILELIEKDQKAILISNLMKEVYEEGDYIVKGDFL